MSERKSRATTAPGEPLTLWGLVALLDEHYNRAREHGPGRLLLVRNGYENDGAQKWKRVPLMHYLCRSAFADVIQDTRNARIWSARYLEIPSNLGCRCWECDKKRVKKPRGPKREPDGTIKEASAFKYRGGMPQKDVVALVRKLRAVRAKWDKPPGPKTL